MVTGVAGRQAMAELNDTDFYLRREREARAMAERASDEAIRAIHADFADRYARQLAVLERAAAPIR